MAPASDAVFEATDFMELVDELSDNDGTFDVEVDTGTLELVEVSECVEVVSIDVTDIDEVVDDDSDVVESTGIIEAEAVSPVDTAELVVLVVFANATLLTPLPKN